MEIYTAGFAGWSAPEFFGRLREVHVRRLVDVRLHNTSQLAGFAKRDDLAYFLDALVGISYEHDPLLAPTSEMLDAYRRKRLSWDEYAAEFAALLDERRVHEQLSRRAFETPTLLLCSEHRPDRCHRRLVVQHLGRHWRDVRAVDLVRGEPAGRVTSGQLARHPGRHRPAGTVVVREGS
jgi:uncharacterized protein (DUF488 family)